MDGPPRESGARTMRVQQRFIVLHDLSSPLPAIGPKETFRIMDGNPPAYADYRGRLRKRRRRCCYCGKSCIKNGQLDHRIPIGRGGLSTTSNLVLCCEFCNRTKNCMTDREYLALVLQAIHRMRRRIRHERLTASNGTFPKRRRELVPA